MKYNFFKSQKLKRSKLKTNKPETQNPKEMFEDNSPDFTGSDGKIKLDYLQTKKLELKLEKKLRTATGTKMIITENCSVPELRI